MSSPHVPNSNQPGSRGPSRPDVAALLRDGAPRELVEPTGRLSTDVIREIRRGRASRDALVEASDRGAIWRALAGTLAAALVGIVVWYATPLSAPPPAAPTTMPSLAISPRRTVQPVLEVAARGEQSLQEEARRLRSDVTRGVNFLRSTLAVARIAPSN